MAKILFVMDDINYAGGAHYATFHIANYLCQEGHCVSIYSPKQASSTAKALLHESITFLKKETFKGFDYIVVPFENSAFREKVAKVKDAIKIQWVHIDYELWKDIAGVDLNKERTLYAAYDKIVFVSEQNRRGFINLFPAFEAKCQVANNFLDIDSVRAKANESIDGEIFEKASQDQLNIVVAARLEPQKAYHRLLDVAKILNDRSMNVEWFILGAGYEYHDLQSRCIAHALNNVHFLGFRRNPYPYIKQADVFALLSDYEGLALSLAESMSLGTPVFSTKSGGVGEVMTDDLGWIVENHITAIVDQITEIYNNREMIALKKDRLAKYQYDNEKIAQTLTALFGGSASPQTTFESEGMKNMQTQTKKSPLVSVIVPVYNMELYLAECLESLVHQTLKDIEIIIVNDGSTDKSHRIIADYVYHYPDIIRAFTIENRGLGEARNYGITKAKGKYLGFVDSDDVVRLDMYETLYKAAATNNSDCVICDYIATWENGKQEYVSSIPVQNPDRFDFLKYSARYGCVNAWSKLFDRVLFDKIQYSKGFYEDLSTTPVLLSYANKIAYVKEGLYFYRQRSGSITSIKNNDKRLFDSYIAWDRILTFGNPIFKKELEFAVYWSINFFCTDFLDEFTANSRAYYLRNKEKFLGNEYIAEAIRKGEFLDFKNLPEIPKTIHYCWFGGSEKSRLIEKCIQSWKTYAPDFEIIEWNETNCDIQENEYVKKAYKEKKYAFVSDYFRLKALYEHGGIYLDTDMELMQPIEPYLYYNAFFAFETPIHVHAGILGAVPHCKLIRDILHTYDKDCFELGENGIPKPIPVRITEILETDPLFIKNGKTQRISNHVKIYSANIMTMNFHDGMCVANHHYEGSWMKKGNTPSSYNYGHEVLKHYFTWDYCHAASETGNRDLAALCDAYKWELDLIYNSKTWKLTQPLRSLAAFVRRLLGRKPH